MIRRLAAVLALILAALATGASAQDHAAEHRGGVLRLTANQGPGSLDVQINYMLKAVQLFACAYDGLVTFSKVGGAESVRIVPDLADSVPTPTDGGTTYVFHLRDGIKFSDGRDVTVRDAAASLRRLFKVGSPNAGTWYAGIVGATACLADHAGCTLAGGVMTDDAARTLTIRLTAPDPEFLDKIALPFASIIPADTPLRDLGVSWAAGTGAYMFASYDPQSGIRMVRNPHFQVWSDAAQPAGYPDEIVYSFGLDNEAEVTSVENGQQDWMFEPAPLDRLGELGTRHADLVHIMPIAAYDYVALNTRLPPFDNIKARQAVAYAVDRRAVVSLFGGPRLAQPLCQTLPAGVNGFAPYCQYTLNPGPVWTKPDLARARQLMVESGTIGQKVTIISSDQSVDHSIGVYLQSLLNSLGFQASVRAISSTIQFNYIQNTNNRVQASTTAWEADYPSPSDFIGVLFSCANFHPGSDASINISGYCDPTTQAMLDQALTTSPAAAQWTALDRRITDAAPVVTLFQRTRLDLLSARVGNHQFSEIYNMLFSQAWVQ